MDVIFNCQGGLNFRGWMSTSIKYKVAIVCSNRHTKKNNSTHLSAQPQYTSITHRQTHTYPTGSARPLPRSAEKLSRRKSSTKAARQHRTDRFLVRRDNGGDVGLCKHCASDAVVGLEIKRRNITRLNRGTLTHGFHLCVTDTRLQLYSANTPQIRLLLHAFINWFTAK